MDNLSEILVTTYPKTISLDDGTPVTLRPLLKADEAALAEYFVNLPPEDRLCLKDDVTNPKVIENWIYEMNYDTLLPLIALKQLPPNCGRGHLAFQSHRLDQTPGGTASDHLYPIPGAGTGDYPATKSY